MNRDNDSPLIYWNNDHLLNWSDFKGTPDLTSHFPASCRVGFVCECKVDHIKTKNKFKFKINSFQIKAIFRPLLSWVILERVSESGNSILLKHEQGHFDLAEEFARKSNAQLNFELKNKSFSVRGKTAQEVDENTKKLVNEIQDKIMMEIKKKFNKQEEFYDKETNHGVIFEKQKVYDGRFQELRKQYDA